MRGGVAVRGVVVVVVVAEVVDRAEVVLLLSVVVALVVQRRRQQPRVRRRGARRRRRRHRRLLAEAMVHAGRGRSADNAAAGAVVRKGQEVAWIRRHRCSSTGPSTTATSGSGRGCRPGPNRLGRLREQDAVGKVDQRRLRRAVHNYRSKAKDFEGELRGG